MREISRNQVTFRTSNHKHYAAQAVSMTDLKTVFSNWTDNPTSSSQRIYLAESNVPISMVKETLLVKVLQRKAVTDYKYSFSTNRVGRHGSAFYLTQMTGMLRHQSSTSVYTRRDR